MSTVRYIKVQSIQSSGRTDITNTSNTISNFFTSRASMHWLCHVLLRLTELSGVVLTSFTPFRSSLFTKVSPLQPEDSTIGLSLLQEICLVSIVGQETCLLTTAMFSKTNESVNYNSGDGHELLGVRSYQVKRGQPMCLRTYVSPYLCVPVPMCLRTDVSPYRCVPRLGLETHRYGNRSVRGHIGTWTHRYGYT